MRIATSIDKKVNNWDKPQAKRKLNTCSFRQLAGLAALPFQKCSSRARRADLLWVQQEKRSDESSAVFQSASVSHSSAWWWICSGTVWAVISSNHIISGFFCMVAYELPKQRQPIAFVVIALLLWLPLYWCQFCIGLFCCFILYLIYISVIYTCCNAKRGLLTGFKLLKKKGDFPSTLCPLHKANGLNWTVFCF